MKGAIAWFARNPVAANLVMFILLTSGALTLGSVKQEVFPEVSLDRITVSVTHLGAAPQEVEEAVCIRIEEAIQGIDGIKEITSTAAEGNGTVMIELELGADARRALDDIKARVDAITTFPEETEKPVVQELTNRRQVVNLAVSGPLDDHSLKRLAERVRDDLAAIPGITQVEISAARPYEISIEVSEDDLRRYGLSFDFVAGAIRRSSLNLPGGSVRTAGGEILLRTAGQAYRGAEFADLVLLTHPDGTQLRLGDVARVVDGFAQTDQRSRFNGEPALMLQVFRTGEQGALEISRAVRAYAEHAQARMPEGVRLTAWSDTSTDLRDRVDLLTRNGLTGFILVVIGLALFLRMRLAFWVSLGIPISFLGAMALMPALDVSINMLSLFAFVVVLGIVVDDAIVVGENIHTHQDRHGEGLRGAIEGAQEMAVPVTFAILTTIAAFMPLIASPGTFGKIVRVIPLIVVPCLVFSLVESLLILPAHLSHLPRRQEAKSAWHRFQGRAAGGLQAFSQKTYRPLLERAIESRYLSASVGISTLVLTLGLVAGGLIKFVFLPTVEANYVAAQLTMPLGTPAEVTSDAIALIEQSAERLRTELESEGEDGTIRHIYAAVGEQPFRLQQQRNQPGAVVQRVSSGHLGEVTLELAPAEVRDIGSVALATRWRELTGSIPDAVELSFSASLFSTGDSIDVQLTGQNLDELRSAADELKRRLGEYAGVYEITDSFREGKREVRLGIKPAAELLGLSLKDLARQVRQGFYGEEAQRIQRGRDDLRVMVRYPETERRSLAALEQMRIRTPDGASVPFSQVATVEEGRGFATIRRVDRRRSINVTADVDNARANEGEIIDDIGARVLPELLAEHPGVLASFEGQSAEQRDTLAGLGKGFGYSLLAIYALLAVPLRSYVQPVIIMLAIPFGLVGAVWGHVAMGLDLTMLSLFGIVALAGVVVNDSLIIVDFINRHRAESRTLQEAVCEAGVRRFRPVLLTSLTTFLGLLPLLLERSMQAKFMIPMAVSLAFGVVFATVITLLLVPVSYVILQDLQQLLGASSGDEVTSEATLQEAGAYNKST